jgi:hypothetical protein
LTWTLVYRGSLFGFDASSFHRACEGDGKFVVVVQAENGRIATAYTEDGFSSPIIGYTLNRNGFIVSIEDDGSCGVRFDRRNENEISGVFNFPEEGPVFNDDLWIKSDCNVNGKSFSRMGYSYGDGDEAKQFSLFGQEFFRVRDYEVYKVVIG